jgi:Protein of unknown function (DUF1302)
VRQANPIQCRLVPAGLKQVAAAVAVMCGGSLLGGNAMAFEVDTGNPDLAITFDNTVRANYAVRAQSRDPKIGNAVVADEGDYLFNNGQAVAKRIDLLSEFDLVFQKRFGFRVSGAAWYDGAYGDQSKSNPNPPFNAIPSYVNNQFSPDIHHLYHEGAEVLDSFVFANGNIGDVPVSGKFGRHTIYWGESLYLGGNLHSIAYAQAPLDLQKGFATPGTEVKELFRPLNQLSGQAQLTDTVSVAGQYLLQWQPARYPEGGTYLGPVDFAFNAPERQFLSGALGFAYNGPASKPPQQGEFGLSTRWSPQWLDGTAGLYYRDFADKLPQVFVTKVAPASGSIYNMIYADHIHLLGASLAKNIGPVSASTEISYRKNTPLNSQTLGIAVGLPGSGDTKGPRGDTVHGLFNVLGTAAKTPVFDAATFGAELQWMHLVAVTSGGNLFNGLGYTPCNATATAPAKTKWDGCATTNYAGVSASFTPTWFQVIPGVDLSAPLTYAVGIKGNAATTFGGNQGLGNYTLGVGADWLQKYRFDLKYVGFQGHYKDNGTAVTSTNGFTTYLDDRGFVSLTFKTTF